jgi:hypothetical protein
MNLNVAQAVEAPENQAAVAATPAEAAVFLKELRDRPLLSEAVADLAVQAAGFVVKCITQFAQNAAKKPKYLLCPAVHVQFIAAIAIASNPVEVAVAPVAAVDSPAAVAAAADAANTSRHKYREKERLCLSFFCPPTAQQFAASLPAKIENQGAACNTLLRTC